MLPVSDTADVQARRSTDSTIRERHERRESRERVAWGPLAVPPLTLAVVAVAVRADSPGDLAIATLSLLALALAAAAFAAARGGGPQ